MRDRLLFAGALCLLAAVLCALPSCAVLVLEQKHADPSVCDLVLEVEPFSFSMGCRVSPKRVNALDEKGVQSKLDQQPEE